MKRITCTLALVLALLMMCLVSCEISSIGSNDICGEDVNAVTVFTLDVNPGVRLYVKNDGTVITVEATNVDGEEIVSEIEFEGANYETVVEDIIDKMEEKGFLEGEESAVLISVEKEEIEISEKLNEKIEEAFEKHGKRASVIEQELFEINGDAKKKIEGMAKKYNISEGKAHLIEKIREEFPELPEEELAGLKVNDLGVMLEDTSDDVRGQFKKVDPAVEDAYVGREQALAIALESLSITDEDIALHRVIATRENGKMVYEVKFVYEGVEYEISVDAESGIILMTESENFEEFDAEGFINDYNENNKVDLDKIKDQMINEALGTEEHKDEQKEEHRPGGKEEHADNISTDESCLSRGEILRSVMAELGIPEQELKRTDVKLYETEEGAVFYVSIKTKDRDMYKLVVEAYTGAVLKAELNGTALEINVEVTG